MDQEKIRSSRRLSIITDLLIFILILIIVFLIINIFDFNLKISGSEYEELALVSNQDLSLESVREENIYYINKIKSKYNININYGQSTKNYASKVDANIQEDEIIINNNLKLLIKALEKYPEDLFININKSNYSISILLIDRFNNDNLALASRNNLNEYKIYISNNDKFERAFHHEMYHVLEYYMNSKDSNLNSTWYLFNPSGFNYQGDVDNLDREFVYYTKYDLESSYFVTKYSKVSDKEDRAELFAEVMVMDQKKEYLNEGQNIYFKVIYILNNIHKLITGSQMYIDKIVNY